MRVLPFFFIMLAMVPGGNHQGTDPPENISLKLHPNNTLGVRFDGSRPDNFDAVFSWLDGVDRSSRIEEIQIPVEFGEDVWIYFLNFKNLSREELRQLTITLYFDGREHQHRVNMNQVIDGTPATSNGTPATSDPAISACNGTNCATTATGATTTGATWKRVVIGIAGMAGVVFIGMPVLIWVLLGIGVLLIGMVVVCFKKKNHGACQTSPRQSNPCDGEDISLEHLTNSPPGNHTDVVQESSRASTRSPPSRSTNRGTGEGSSGTDENGMCSEPPQDFVIDMEPSLNSDPASGQQPELSQDNGDQESDGLNTESGTQQPKENADPLLPTFVSNEGKMFQRQNSGTTI